MGSGKGTQYIAFHDKAQDHSSLINNEHPMNFSEDMRVKKMDIYKVTKRVPQLM